jgi:hypothetical protein
MKALSGEVPPGADPGAAKAAVRAFVFTIGVIHHNYHLAFLQVGNDGIDRVEFLAHKQRLKYPDAP